MFVLVSLFSFQQYKLSNLYLWQSKNTEFVNKNYWNVQKYTYDIPFWNKVYLTVTSSKKVLVIVSKQIRLMDMVNRDPSCAI